MVRQKSDQAGNQHNGNGANSWLFKEVLAITSIFSLVIVLKYYYFFKYLDKKKIKWMISNHEFPILLFNYYSTACIVVKLIYNYYCLTIIYVHFVSFQYSTFTVMCNIFILFYYIKLILQ